MLSADCHHEIDTAWLPHMTDSALDRLIELLEKASPLLVHGCFTRTVPMGCLATQVAWHHPATAHLCGEAGIHWLCTVAGLNPATSHVLRAWDLGGGSQNWELRAELRARFVQERNRRAQEAAQSERDECALFAN